MCVLQTCLELKDQGMTAHVCADAVTSQRSFDRSVRLDVFSPRRFRRRSPSSASKAFVHVSTAESLIFQLLGSAEHPQFKSLQPVIKEHAAAAADSPLQQW